MYPEVLLHIYRKQLRFKGFLIRDVWSFYFLKCGQMFTLERSTEIQNSFQITIPIRSTRFSIKNADDLILLQSKMPQGHSIIHDEIIMHHVCVGSDLGWCGGALGLCDLVHFGGQLPENFITCFCLVFCAIFVEYNLKIAAQEV